MPKNGGAGLPAYCDPPNPCPLGYTEKDGCIENFENSSEFSRTYQVILTTDWCDIYGFCLTELFCFAG